MRKSKLFLMIGLFFVVILLVASILLASTTFETKRHSYYGTESAVEKLVVTVIPQHRQDPCDHNDVNSTATDGNSIYGELRRITIAATGTDVNFFVSLKDGMDVNLFLKSDCNTTLLPLSYILHGQYRDSVSTVFPLGLLVAGPLTVDTNYVDPCNLTSITVAIYYLNPSK